MRIYLVGGTGRTGRLVIKLASARGHSITAIVRKPIELQAHDRLSIVVGNPLRVGDLASIAGHDVLGQRLPHDTRVLQDAAAATIEAMIRHGVRRYLVISQGLLFPSRNPIIYLLRQILARHVADSSTMERIVQASDLEWTIVRPPRLQSGGRQGCYETRAGGRPTGPSAMQRATLAAFLVDEAREARHVRSIVGIAEVLRPGAMKPVN